MPRPAAGPRILHRLAPGVEPGRYRRFSVEPVGATLGTFANGLDLCAPLDEAVFAPNGAPFGGKLT